VPTTKIRSILISGCFLSYGIGSIVINIVTLYINRADFLIALASVLVLCTVAPTFCSFYETPLFLHNTGQYTRLLDTLESISRMNGKWVTRYEFLDQMITEDEFNLIQRLENCPGLWRVELTKETLTDHSKQGMKKAFKDLFFKKK